MRRPEATSWWFVLLLWSVLLPLAVSALSTYLRDGVVTYLFSFITYLVLLLGLPVTSFLFRARNPKERVAWVSTLTVYLATTVPIFLCAVLVLVTVVGEWWSDGASPAEMVVTFAGVLVFCLALVLRVLEFPHVRDPEYRI